MEFGLRNTLKFELQNPLEFGVQNHHGLCSPPPPNLLSKLPALQHWQGALWSRCHCCMLAGLFLGAGCPRLGAVSPPSPRSPAHVPQGHLNVSGDG